MQEKYGRHTNIELLKEIHQNPKEFKELEMTAMLKGEFDGFLKYEELVQKHNGETDSGFEEARGKAHFQDVCNLQYTSGSTGDPKAAMLTHQ
jgi:long-subunit acyl-CoA synthetase (AMP-forming)